MLTKTLTELSPVLRPWIQSAEVRCVWGGEGVGGGGSVYEARNHILVKDGITVV